MDEQAVAMIGPIAAIARVMGVRGGEGRVIALVAALFAALEAGRGFGEVGVDTLVVSRLGAATLPYLYLALGATSLVTALAYGAALGRVARTPLLVGILVTGAALLVAGRLVLANGLEALVPALWLVTYASGAIALTIAWTVAGSVFDARQAKRLFPICTGAAIAGSFVGTLLSGAAAGAGGTEVLVVLEAVLLVVVAGLVVVIGRTGLSRVPVRRPGTSVLADLRAGFDDVARSPLFRLVAVAYVLFSVLFFAVTYPFLQAAAGAFPREADLATAIGLLSAAITATSFVVSLTIANRVYARFGVATAAVALPLVYLAGFALWLVQFSFATAALVRYAQQVTQRGLSNSAWSALYNVVPGDRRAQVLAFIDGVPGQLGMMLSGLLLLGAGRLFAAEQVFWLGAVTATGATVVVVAIRRRYGESLLRTLRSGLGEQVLEGGPGIAALANDPQVTSALRSALVAPEAPVRRMATRLIGRLAGPTTVDDLLPALTDPDPEVRASAIEGLAPWLAASEVHTPAEAALVDPDARVRAAAVRALCHARLPEDASLVQRIEGLAADPSPAVRAAVAVALEERDDGSAVRALLSDPAPQVREATIQAVAASGGLAHSERIAPVLLGSLGDPSPSVRRTAAALLAARDDDTNGLLDVLRVGEPDAQDAALLALDGHAAAVHAEVVAWAEAQIATATARRRARAALAAAPDATDGARATNGARATVAFLSAVLGHREARATGRALGALAVLGTPEAGGVVRRCLGSRDPEIRAQAMEALDSIGDRRLRQAIVRLLDADLATGSADRDATLRALADDGDRWISTLARRAIGETMQQGGDDAMADTARTIGSIDTMLMLRRVPLFDGLDPEDLQRIASTCGERLFPAGTVLMREGDLASELMVLVEGSVRVVRVDASGAERLIRHYQAGDHIGELAVLRERPRAATVVADEDVRVLVIHGESLKAILRERPDAAMAMLATLAERISAQ
jgi:HEAT repeat protein